MASRAVRHTVGSLRQRGIRAALPALAAAALGAGLLAAPAAADPPTTPTTTNASPTVPANVPDGFVAAATTWSTPTRGYVIGTTDCADDPCWALLTTGDAGKTWQERAVPPKHLRPRQVVRLVSAPNEQQLGGATVYVSNGNWLYGSHDGGATWARVPLKGITKPAAVGDLAVSHSRLYAIVGDGERESGQTRLFLGHVTGKRLRPADGVRIDGNGVGVDGGWDVAVRNRNVAVALGQIFTSAGYWTASDGHTFTDSAAPCVADAVPAIGAVTAKRVDVLCSYNPGMGHMFKDLYTASLGGAFTKTESAPDLGITEQYVATAPGENTITAIGGASILYRSSEAGWEQPLFLPEALEFSNLQYASRTVGYVLWGGPIHGQSTLYRTADGGHTWDALPTSE